MSNPTPEELLALARACMPDLVPRIAKMKIDGEKVCQVWVNGPDYRTGSDPFDPIASPAHAWAVFKHLVERYDANDMESVDWWGDELEEIVFRRAIEEVRRSARMKAHFEKKD